MRSTLFISLATLALGVGVTAWAFAGRSTAAGKTRIDAGQAAIVTEMRSLGRLESSSFTIEKIIEADKNQAGRLSDFLFGDKLLLIAHGEVVAGIDMSGLAASDISTIDGKLHLRLPATQILNVSLDDGMTRVYDRTQGLFSRADKDLETEARQAAVRSIREAACDSGILKAASENAAKQIKAMLAGLGFEGAVIEIAQGSC